MDMRLRKFSLWMKLGAKIDRQSSRDTITREERDWLLRNTAGLWFAFLYRRPISELGDFLVVGPLNIIRVEWSNPAFGSAWSELSHPYGFFPAKPHEGFVDVIKLIRGWEGEDHCPEGFEHEGTVFAPSSKTLMHALQRDVPASFKAMRPRTAYKRKDHVEERAAIERRELAANVSYVRWTS